MTVVFVAVDVVVEDRGRDCRRVGGFEPEASEAAVAAPERRPRDDAGGKCWRIFTVVVSAILKLEESECSLLNLDFERDLDLVRKLYS